MNFKRWLLFVVYMVSVLLLAACGPLPVSEHEGAEFAYTSLSDIRLTDEDYKWTLNAMTISYCVRCHSRSNLETNKEDNVAAAIKIWDIETRPVWTDGVSAYALKQMYTPMKDGGRPLPLSNFARFRSFVTKELKRREEQKKIK